ncbi:MAG: ribosome maturation factor RimM [Thiohalocapsa sp.]
MKPRRPAVAASPEPSPPMGESEPVERRVCVGVVTGAHGVRGAVRLKSFTAEPGDIASYGPLQDESGRRQYKLRVTATAKGVLIATLDGVADRDQAEALRGLRLYLPRSALPPPPEDEYYHADLIGLTAELGDGAVIGTVCAVHDFGAGDMLEIARLQGPPVLVPFTKAVVPIVDLAAGRLIVDPPPGLFDDPKANSRQSEPAA